MVKPAIAFLSGCLLVAWLPQLPSIYWLFALLPLIFIAWKRAYWAVFFCLLAILWASGQAYSRIDNQLDSTLTGQNILLSGTIISLPHHNGQRVRFEFSPDSNQGKLPDKIRLSWYFPPETVPQAGEKWQLLLRLKTPQGMANPGGFDYESWLFQQRIGATGYVRQSEHNQKLQPAKKPPSTIGELS